MIFFLVIHILYIRWVLYLSERHTITTENNFLDLIKSSSTTYLIVTIKGIKEEDCKQKSEGLKL